MNKSLISRLEETKKFLKKQIKESPDIALVLGSGLGPLVGVIENPISISYKEIPFFAKATVSGHAGELISGKLHGKSIICMKGRFHYYEGHSLDQLIYPIQLFKMLGAKILILTNAAGAINNSFTPGDLMVITDHINFTGINCLIGPNPDEIGPRFPDLSDAYSKRLREIARKAGVLSNLPIREGVYVATTGPSYETPAEIKMFHTMGADAVGMSTVPEVIAANHAGLEVFAISCITNLAAGVGDQKLSHDEVTETATRVQKDFINFLSLFIKEL